MLTPRPLLGVPIGVVNIGLEVFADAVAASGAPVVRVRWSPPARGDAALAQLARELLGTPTRHELRRQSPGSAPT
jgi:hypothetical protein